jgi:hypothetical protein
VIKHKYITSNPIIFNSTELQLKNRKQLKNMQTNHNKAIYSKKNVEKVLFLQFNIVVFYNITITNYFIMLLPTSDIKIIK